MPSSMDDRRHFAPVDVRRDSPSSLPFAEQREQIRRFLGELSETTASAEAEIAGVVKRLLDDFSIRKSDGGASSQELAARDAALASERAKIEELQRQINEQRAEIERLRQGAAQRSGESAEAEQRLEAATRELDSRRRQLELDAEETARLKQRLEDKLRRQETLEEELEAERTRTKSQRRRIAAELREQADAAKREYRRHLDDLEARREDLERREQTLQARTAELERQAADLASAVAAAADKGDDSALREELSVLRQSLAERSAALAQAEAEASAIRQELLNEKEELADAQARLERQAAVLRRAEGAETEAAELRNLLDEARAKLTAAEANDDAAADLRDLQSALAIAQEDLRDLRNRNAMLEKTQAQAAADRADAPLAMDWESQKRRLLAALESDFDPNKPTERADRLTIEGTIQITDNIVAEKDREIAELRGMLEQQSCNVGDVTVGGAALAAALDQDDLIREHRTQIEDLKRQWEEKLRAAEVEISIERAKVARERTILEEKRAEIEAWEARAAKDNAQPGSVDANDPKRKGAGGGRWLARLGLRDGEQQ